MSRINLSTFDWLAPRSSSSVEHEVGDKLIAFYPLSPLKLPIFQDVFKVVARSIREATYRARDEAGARDEEEERTGVRTSISTYIPMSVEMSKEHAARRAKAIDEFVGTLLNEKTMILISLCLLDSMRDEIERDPDKPFTEKEGKDLLALLDIPTFMQMTVGMVKANMESFGPLGKKAARKAMTKVEDLLAEQGVPGPSPIPMDLSNADPTRAGTSVG